MERKTLTEWPAELPEGRWEYVTNAGSIVSGSFVESVNGGLLFESDVTGSQWEASGFTDGETFVSLGADPDSRDPRIAALEEENAALKASGEANADAVSEHAAISALMAADPVLCRYGVLEAFQMLKARADEACGEPAPLRLGRGPTVEEVAAHEPAGGCWLLRSEVTGRWDEWTVTATTFTTLLFDGRTGLMLEDFDDAIPLNASRQPCGVGVKL